MANEWYLAGGINPANCVAAYQPKGAASYAASKINIANPGTHDAYEGTAPDWDATAGWKFIKGNKHYLKSGFIPANDQSWSVILRYSGYTDTEAFRWFCGSYVGGSTRFGIGGASSRDKASFSNGGELQTNLALGTEGVIALAGNKGYMNSVVAPNNIPSGTGALNEFFMGAVNLSNNSSNNTTINVQAFAIYSTPLTALQVAALTTAMNAIGEAPEQSIIPLAMAHYARLRSN